MSTLAIILAISAALLLGIAKAGLKGTSILIVSFMAIAFGAKESTGVLLPILIVGDILAVMYYNRHAQWNILIKFLPWMILGVLIGVFVGKDLDEFLFKKMMSVIIIISVIIMVWWERSKKQIPQKMWFAGLTGTAAGFTTMIGNLAGAFANIYFLAMRIPKEQFIGTAAWLFFIVNVFKIPFHVFSWKTINPTSLMYDLYLAPFVVIGFFIGVKIVSYFNDQAYRNFILIVTAVAAIILLIR
ncbi:sulfite exporter TauE/SafE family protein [Portibacter lacus]|uniref:Probable membrane transporter protein n=1 Tax=Portibacter lacus TaxID=1099794 RepID=A0AA37WDY5_9BACT|nr:sulfite exporter TauE/SafE family protein [Portibacter lacus]GLR16124.1 anion permease [Portibacter lacus]